MLLWIKCTKNEEMGVIHTEKGAWGRQSPIVCQEGCPKGDMLVETLSSRGREGVTWEHKEHFFDNIEHPLFFVF